VRIEAGEVHLWVTRPPSVDVARIEALLPAEEITRAAGFRFEKNQREHLVTRALLRSTLSRYVPEIAPREWRWKLGAHGKPVVDPPCGLFFNVSNHPDMVVCVVARQEAIGVDVEPLARGEEIVEVADTVFAPEEQVGLTPDRAVTLWTAKEAWIKALGLGFSAPVRDMVVDLSGAAPAIAGAWVAVVDRDGHRIAIVVHGEVERLRMRSFDGFVP
jgi:4'-phosphopantetheinyl transferase